MGVQNFSISDSSYTQEGERWGVLVYEAEDASGARDIRLVWSTEFGSDVNVSWTMSITPTVLHRKGGSNSIEALSVGTTYTQTFQASECHESKPQGDDGRVWWSHSLDVNGMLADICGATRQFMYSSRVYDGMSFNASVYSTWAEGEGIPGQTHSETVWLDFSINYCPVYALTDAYYDIDPLSDAELFVIEYTTSWTRKDDRFAIEISENAIGGASRVEGRPLLNDYYWDTVAARGRLEVPVSYLTEHVVGKQIYLNVRFNATFRPIDLFFANAAKNLTVSDHRTCNTPVLTLLSSGETVRIRVTDSGDMDVPADRVTVKMLGSRYSVDQVTVEPGEVAEFRYAPYGTTVKFQAVGYNDSGAVSGPSNVVSATTRMGSTVSLDAVSGSASVHLPLRLSSGDVGPTVDTSPVYDTIKLAGRSAPSAYYGTGTTTSISFSAALLDEDGADVEALATCGDVMCRFPDGRRYCIAPTIRISRKTNRILSLDISGEEVGG